MMDFILEKFVIGNEYLIGVIVSVLAGFIGKKLSREKTEAFCNKIENNLSAKRDHILNIALSPFFGIGLAFSKLVLSKIGSKSSKNFEEKIIITLTTVLKTLISLIIEVLIIPILYIPKKTVERFEQGMLSDNLKKGNH